MAEPLPPPPVPRGPCINIYPSEVVGMTKQQLLASSGNTQQYVAMFLQSNMLVLKDGVLAWPEKQEEEELQFSTTEEF